MTDVGIVSVALEVGVTRDCEKGAGNITQEKLHQTRTGAERVGEVQPLENAECGTVAFIGSAVDEGVEQGEKEVRSGY